MRKTLLLCLLICLPLPAQVIPTATELPGDPFYVKKTWLIGGEGNWDSLTVDPAAQRLYVAHGTRMQVVDLDSGSLLADIQGFREARAIALDDTGKFAYVADGPARAVKVVDRERLVIDSVIPVNCVPRAIAFEPINKVVFAICGAAVPADPPSPVYRSGASRFVTPQAVHFPDDYRPLQAIGPSQVVVIDAEGKSVLATMRISGDFRFAQPDGRGQVYVTVGAVERLLVANGRTLGTILPSRIEVFDASAIAEEAHRQRGERSQPAQSTNDPLWTDGATHPVPGGILRLLRLSSSCDEPHGLAIDANHQRLFVACDGNRLAVLNAQTGEQIASLRTGPGNERIGYDPENGLIFAASGEGDGNLIVIRQSTNTDSYAVIQNLPTRERARTLAVDSATGAVYLVTESYGIDLAKKGGIGALQSTPVQGSFQVLVIGH
jgi:DNA-binding beta-propeller fold protein YncE